MAAPNPRDLSEADCERFLTARYPNWVLDFEFWTPIAFGATLNLNDGTNPYAIGGQTRHAALQEGILLHNQDQIHRPMALNPAAVAPLFAVTKPAGGNVIRIEGPANLWQDLLQGKLITENERVRRAVDVL